MALRPPRHGFSVARRLSERARAAREQEDRTGGHAGADPDISAPGGFAGMVEALRGLVEQLATTAREAADAASAETGADDASSPAGVTRTASFADGKGRMVFGYTLRMGRDGVSAEPFGDVPQGAPAGREKPAPKPASSAPAARQPIVDIFEDGDTVVVVAELPGADPDAISCRVDEHRLLIEAGGAQRYRKELALPAPVRSEGLVQSFRNGILEVRLARAEAP